MNWLRRVALAVMIVSLVAPMAMASGFPWKAGDTPPAIAGIVLGDTDEHARQVLGAPGGTSKMGVAYTLDYPAAGLQLILTKDDGVSIIRLQTAKAGAVDGIRVGDKAPDVVTKWGPPHQTSGRTALYNAGTWTVTVRLADQAPKIVDILVGWNTTKWPDADLKKGQFFRPK